VFASVEPGRRSCNQSVLCCVLGFLYTSCLYQIVDTWDVNDDSTQELYKYVVMLIFGSFLLIFIYPRVEVLGEMKEKTSF